MNRFSIRVDEPPDQQGIDRLRKDIDDFLNGKGIDEIIFCREDYSPKLKKVVKPHYHIGFTASITLSSVGQRFLRHCPYLATKRDETKLYAKSQFENTDIDVKNWSQYHCKGRDIGDYEVLRSTFDENTLDKYNEGYWTDRKNFVESNTASGKKKPKQPPLGKKLIEYVKRYEHLFLVPIKDTETIYISSNKKQFLREQCLRKVIQFFSEETKKFRSFLIEEYYNLVEHHYCGKFTEDRLIYDLSDRLMLYNTSYVIDTD